MKNILLISPIYPGPGMPINNTPVVHYFAREWVGLGYNVRAISCPSNFPTIFLLVAKLFHRALESLLNLSIRTQKLDECEYVIGGVSVVRYPLSKMIPHARYRKNQIDNITRRIIDYCERENFAPDVVIGHWTNPALEILPILKSKYKAPVCMTMHDDGANLQSLYKNDYKERLDSIDIIGYRSDAIKRRFEARYGDKDKYVYCYSGVPESFVNVVPVHRTFDKISNFIFVGMMIPRKYPLAIIEALQQSNINDYDITYIGEGSYVQKINSVIENNKELQSKIHLLGRINRDDIKKYLKQSDVFVMISKNETFGLVYLEAMSMGCIPIASRDEGFDGIIRDGINGFLCKAGDVEELAMVLNKINQMSPIELQRISCNAVNTAKNFTDTEVAKRYIEDIIKIVENNK